MSIDHQYQIHCLMGRSVFWALFGAIYLCFGMPEVYRVLFEVFGMDPEAEDCQPRERRQLEDVDYVSVEFEGRKLNWQDVAAYKASIVLHVLSTVVSVVLNPFIWCWKKRTCFCILGRNIMYI